MRELKRNRRTIYYALYTGVQEVVDAYGNYTGEYAPSYATPVAMQCNVSAAKGSAEENQFGIDEAYTKTIVTTDMTCPIDVDTILWVDVATTAEHDYAVVRVAKSINSITIAIREVDVRGNASSSSQST